MLAWPQRSNANVLDCAVGKGKKKFEITVNMNFESWHTPDGQTGEMKKIAPNKYVWEVYGGEIMVEMVLSKDGRSGRISTMGEIVSGSGKCKFLTTGRTPGD
ncbi:hypothetical protein ACFPYM_01940 [Methylobacterium hispanicum]|uniref:hypothetical protein n=1 Tax=Methylobacterium hispanicum TaxID=270350 RepID=UPI001EDFE374|nr:hypothetical protein [Methylobacterium hispanicum]